jgi:hypothetical protein
VTGLALGVAAGFVGSLLRGRRDDGSSGYLAPVAANGPQAVPPPEAGPVVDVIRFPDNATEDGPPRTGRDPAGADADGEDEETPDGGDAAPGAVLRIRLPGDSAVG